MVNFFKILSWGNPARGVSDPAGTATRCALPQVGGATRSGTQCAVFLRLDEGNSGKP
jgi:hypothetical protein